MARSQTNTTTEEGLFDFAKDLDCEELIKELDLPNIDLDNFINNKDIQETDIIERNKLQDRFIIPPFSVLDTRQGYWQDRKRKWIALGIKGELGRGDKLGAIPPNENKLLNKKYGGGKNGTSR